MGGKVAPCGPLSRHIPSMNSTREYAASQISPASHKRQGAGGESQLGQWRKLRRMQVATGGQRGITSYFSHAPHTRAARDAQTADDGPAAAATAASSPAGTAARLTATAATASQLRRLASERTTEQKGVRRRQHDDDDPDGATSESLALSEIDSACADQDASAASA